MLLVGEDTGCHLGCYGSAYADTPNLDRLAAQGCRFDRAYSHAPVCAPSRSGLVAGMYPWTYGGQHMRSRVLKPPRLFTQELRDAAGYHVSWPTKTDFNFTPPGDFADSIKEWLDTDSAPRSPFFVYRNFGITHESCMWDESPHAGRFADRIKRLEESRRHDPAQAPVPPYLPDCPETRVEIARYFDNLSMQDDQVGSALDWLERTGHADDTIVIYLTDHGRGLPREKRWCYPAGLHLPLIVRWPGQLAPASVSNDLIAWVDIAPTILSLCGVAIPERYQGRVFLGPDRAAPRDHVIGGRDRMGEVFDRVRSLTTRRYHYVRNFFPQLPYMQRSEYLEKGLTVQALRNARRDGTLTAEQAPFMAERKAAEELYDLQADPFAVHNLAERRELSDTLRDLRGRLTAELARHGDLGELDESVLIERGIVEDQLDSYCRPLVRPLPPEHRIGAHPTVVTMNEAIEKYGPSPAPSRSRSAVGAAPAGIIE